ncbi:MAG: hypothetical protein ABFR89_02550 [Actinomycetota bacterium]
MNTDQVAADATSALLVTADGDGRIWLKNIGPNTVEIGKSGVLIGDGYPLKIDEEIEIPIWNGTVIHAVCAALETATVAYLQRPPSRR